MPDTPLEALTEAFGMQPRTHEGARALLGAVGWHARTDDEARETHERLRTRLTPLVDPCQVTLLDTQRLRLRAPQKSVWQLTVQPESGQACVSEGRGPQVLELPQLPYGYHAIHVACGSTLTSQLRVVVPTHCVKPLSRAVPRAYGPAHAAPVSRIYRSLEHLNLDLVPELSHSDAAQAALGAGDGPACLRAMFETFCAAHLHGDTPRARAYHAFVATQGVPLYDYGVFCALERHFQTLGDAGGWRTWPTPYQAPQSDAVQRFAAEHATEVGEVLYAQFELDRQLGLLAQTARHGAQPSGPAQTLCISHGFGGADPWMFRSLFVDDASVGTPPSTSCPAGRDHGQPPLNPHVMAQDGYRYWRMLLRNAFAHSGALRIDNILGLFRLFWIPSGMAPSQGAHVRYPYRDLLGILALESQRNDAPVFAQELGRAPRGAHNILSRAGIVMKSARHIGPLAGIAKSAQTRAQTDRHKPS